MPQIKFSVPANTKAYLRWYSREFLADGNENVAAKHLFERGLEKSRRDNLNESFQDFDEVEIVDDET